VASSEGYPTNGERVHEEATMTTIADDAQRIGVLFDRIDELDQVAYSHPDHDDRVQRLLEVADATLAEEAPIRPSVAATLLHVGEKTVREWADNGALIIATRQPRLLLDPRSVYEVSRLIRDLRAMEDDGEPLDEMWRGLPNPAPSAGDIEQRQASDQAVGSVIPRQRSAAEGMRSRRA
jgi:hypothetical protein